MTAVTGEQAGDATGRRSRRRVIVVVAVVVVIVAGAVAADLLLGGSGGSPATTQAATTTAAVVRTDLAETTPVDGTIGYASATTIVEPSGTAASALTQAQQALAAAQQNVSADQRALSDTDSSDAQSVTQAEEAVTAAQATSSSDTAQLQEDQATLTATEQKEAVDCQGSGAAGQPPSGSSGSSGSSGASDQPGGCSGDASQVTADQQKVAADQQKVAADQAAVQNAQGQVTTARQKAAQDADQAGGKVGADELALTSAQSTLSESEAAATSYTQTSTYTALPKVGQVIDPGQALWSVDGEPVVLLSGTLSAWRAFGPGMSAGSDVVALDQALIDLGDGAALRGVSATFTNATATAIDALQRSLGLPKTGELPLGSVVFEPTPVRVTAVHPQVGAPVAGGAPVLDVTSTTPVVNVALPVTQTYLVKVGDAVTVTLPDNSTADGTITAVGSVATASSNSGASNGNNQPSATVNVTVALSHASAAGSLDQAPVTVNITNQSVQQTLAVPTTALLALAGGGYAVEVVDPDGVHHLVGVTTGLFDDQAGLVQVSGSGLDAGQKVVIAQ
jgi:multidrug efflux pump subunit AcrA (membrane-fusion protein)